MLTTLRRRHGRLGSGLLRLCLFEEDLRHQEGPEDDGHEGVDDDHEDHEWMQHAGIGGAFSEQQRDERPSLQRHR